MAHPGRSTLARHLRDALAGEVLFDAASRGRYSTDASIYQIEPVGVVVPRHAQDVRRAMAIAADAGVPLLARGGGTSQCGQTVGEALVIDYSKHMNRLLALDPVSRRARVEPGIVLDQLNAQLRPHGLFFPIDVSTSSRATIGGMTGNNSCGARSIRYGNMVHNVLSIDAVLADGREWTFGPVTSDLGELDRYGEYRGLIGQLRSIADGAATAMAERWPKLLRRVGGYNLDLLFPDEGGSHNMAHILVGSEGTLANFLSIDLALSEIPPHKVLGVCHFPTFYQAMASTRHIVELGPSAVELVDRAMIELSRDIAMFRPIVERFVQGEPDAVLLVEFAGEDCAGQIEALDRLETLMADLGFAGGVVRAEQPAFQSQIWELRKAGLNIMMSMKGDGKPVSFIEDCAVALDDLADYTERLTEVFAKHGTTGTWYAHASVGCLHVRPILNMKDGTDVVKMRAIAEAAFAMVREYKGSHSGEHGDGLVRSEFHEPMFGPQLTDAFAQVKRAFDPKSLMNPGKIVQPPKMDDRSLFRFKPGYATQEIATGLEWSPWHGFAGAVEMCNNNGACRKLSGAVMCPSYRATRNEEDVTRGRANTLRLALSGQLDGGICSDAVAQSLSLCVGCKGCKRECPTGVDMARMKTEVLYQRAKHGGLSMRDKLIAYLPRYAPSAHQYRALWHLRDQVPGLAVLSEYLFGLSARRSLPKWHADPFKDTLAATPSTATPSNKGAGSGREAVFFADTFNRWFEPDNARAALKVLVHAGYSVRFATPPAEALHAARPLCCGRTFLAAGLIDEAKVEARRTVAALAPFVGRGVPVIGLEPSCLLTLRDEFGALLGGRATAALAAKAMLFEEFLHSEHEAGHLALTFAPQPRRHALLHGHCHQKAFGIMGSVSDVLKLIPNLEVSTIESSCCGMAGAFGYEAAHYDISMKMGELGVLPRVREAGEDTLIVADGTSCRHQIADGAGRQARHVAQVLASALATV
ncbi:MAG: FAD-binding protein [Gammaproteobacteria bacterium]|nr:FAD-binding protein [Gammaproteobacteria bacterium]